MLSATELSRLLGYPVQIRSERIHAGHIAEVARIHLTRVSASPTQPSPSLTSSSIALPEPTKNRAPQSSLPRTLIFKRESISNAQGITQIFSSHPRERFFYESIAPTLGIPTPKLWAASAPGTRPGWLLLEDVQDPEAAPLNPDQTLTRLGQLHESTLDQAVTTITFAQNVDDLYHYVETLSQQKLSRFLGQLAERSPGLSQQLYSDWVQRALPISAAPACLIHCDFRWDNLGTKGGVTVFDWGDYCQGPASFDLSFFIMTSCQGLAPDDETGWRQLIDAYQQGLSKDSSLADYAQTAAFKAEVQRLARLVAWTPAMLLLDDDAMSPDKQQYWHKVLDQCGRWSLAENA